MRTSSTYVIPRPEPLPEVARRFLRTAGFDPDIVQAVAECQWRVLTNTPYEGVVDADEFRRRYGLSGDGP